MTADTVNNKVTLEVNDINKGEKQFWTQEYDTDQTTFSLRNSDTGLYLTAVGASALELQPAINWTFPSGGVAGVIRNKNDKKVLEVQGGKLELTQKQSEYKRD